MSNIALLHSEWSQWLLSSLNFLHNIAYLFLCSTGESRNFMPSSDLCVPAQEMPIRNIVIGPSCGPTPCRCVGIAGSLDSFDFLIFVCSYHHPVVLHAEQQERAVTISSLNDRLWSVLISPRTTRSARCLRDGEHGHINQYSSRTAIPSDEK